jgi:hypothetical protein
MGVIKLVCIKLLINSGLDASNATKLDKPAALTNKSIGLLAKARARICARIFGH